MGGTICFPVLYKTVFAILLYFFFLTEWVHVLDLYIKINFPVSCSRSCSNARCILNSSKGDYHCLSS